MSLRDQIRQARREVWDEWARDAEGSRDGTPPASILAFELRHAVSGRLRVAFPRLGPHRGTVQGVVRHLSSAPGVRRVSSNPRCSSVTVEYDPDQMEQDALLDRLRRLTLQDLAVPREEEEERPAPKRRSPGPQPGSGQGRSRLLWTIGGTLFVGLSMLGVVLPGLPTAPFVLLAAYCYLRGSRRLYVWLLEHPVLGRFVEETETGVRISRKAKKVTAYLLWVSIAISCTFFLHAWSLRAVMVLIGLTVSYFLLRRPPAEASLPGAGEAGD